LSATGLLIIAAITALAVRPGQRRP
jgi:hypothetical protein